jgi:hypothetical protein
MTEKINCETTEKKYIRLPRKLVLDLRDAKYLGTGTSYASCIAFAMILARLTPITGDSESQTIWLKCIRKQWSMYGYNQKTLWSLIRNIGTSPLATYIVIDTDNASISVTHQWLSAVVNHVDANNLNYIRVPIGVIPLVRTHAPAVDAVLYAIATRGRPHVAPNRHHQIPHAKLRSMIAEVQKALQNTDNTQKSTKVDNGVMIQTRGANIIAAPCTISEPLLEQTIADKW